MKLSNLKSLIKKELKTLKERKYLPPGRPLGSNCNCCELCGIDMEGAPWSVGCGQACAMLCEEHCSGGMGTEPVTIKISRR